MFKRLHWYWTCDRLGPDIPLTHILLFSKKLGAWVCRKKFKSFGKNSEFRPYAYAMYASSISIGNNVVIRPGTTLMADSTEEGNIIIEDGAMLGPGVHMYVNDHRFDQKDVPIQDQGYYPSKEVRVCKGAWIGANAILLLGVTVGENAVVGAGSVVTKDVEPFTVVSGVPAKMIRKID